MDQHRGSDRNIQAFNRAAARQRDARRAGGDAPLREALFLIAEYQGEGAPARQGFRRFTITRHGGQAQHVWRKRAEQSRQIGRLKNGQRLQPALSGAERSIRKPCLALVARYHQRLAAEKCRRSRNGTKIMRIADAIQNGQHRRCPKQWRQRAWVQ